MKTTVNVELDTRVRWGRVIPSTEPVNGPNERCIELPLALEAMRTHEPGAVLDAGSALNGTVHQIAPWRCTVVHLTQNIASEKIFVCPSQPVSYVSGDLRQLSLYANHAFARTVCISTLEHVGLSNAGYMAPVEYSPATVRQALKELCRVTRDTLLITLPYHEPPVGNERWRFVGDREIAQMGQLMTDHGFTVDAAYYGKSEAGWFGGNPQPVDVSDDGFPHRVNAIVCLRGSR